MALYGKRKNKLVSVSELARYADNPSSIFESNRQLRAKQAKLNYGTRFHREAGEGRSKGAVIVFLVLVATVIYLFFKLSH